MAYEDLRERGLLEDIKPNFGLVNALIGRATKDLVTARATLPIDREWAYGIAYQGMFRAARAAVIAEGLRPRGREQQRTVVVLAASMLGEEGKQTSNAFDRMRRHWQMILEDPGHPVSRYETEAAIADAEAFVELIVRWTRVKNPQLSLL
jgi:hypothetical protein